MERVLSPEDRIRRAEELAELRRANYGTYRRENTNIRNEEFHERKYVLLKKMCIQTVLCFIIYGGFWSVKNNNYFFSVEMIKCSNQVLSTDVNFVEIYNNGINFFKDNYKINNEENNIEEENKEKETDVKEEKKENADAVEEKNEENEENAKTEEKTLSQMEQDVNYIKEKITLSKPLNGRVSSEFGEREDKNPIVTKVHNGIDIAAVKGTDIKSAMDGVVDIATTSSSYGKYIEISNNDIKTLYAHCNKLNVKKGDNVKRGQKIAEVGETRKCNTDPIYILK